MGYHLKDEPGFEENPMDGEAFSKLPGLTKARIIRSLGDQCLQSSDMFKNDIDALLKEDIQDHPKLVSWLHWLSFAPNSPHPLFPSFSSSSSGVMCPPPLSSGYHLSVLMARISNFGTLASCLLDSIPRSLIPRSSIPGDW